MGSPEFNLFSKYGGTSEERLLTVFLNADISFFGSYSSPI